MGQEPEPESEKPLDTMKIERTGEPPGEFMVELELWGTVIYFDEVKREGDYFHLMRQGLEVASINRVNAAMVARERLDKIAFND